MEFGEVILRFRQWMLLPLLLGGLFLIEIEGPKIRPFSSVTADLKEYNGTPSVFCRSHASSIP